LPMAAVAIATMLVGAALGSVNASLVAILKLPSIVVTLASMAILRDAIRWATGGAWVQNLPPNFQWFGLGQTGGEFVIILIAATMFAAFAWGMRNVGSGLAVYVTGSQI